MKKIVKKLFMILMVAAVLPPLCYPKTASAAAGTLTVPSENLGQNQKTYTFTVPENMELNSVSYNGTGTLVSKSLSGKTLSVTIAGQSFSENVTASRNKSDTEYLSRNPGNRIWRYADGKRWQINTYNKSTKQQATYDVTGVDEATKPGIPYEYPADYGALKITTFSDYTNELAMADDKKWVGDTTQKVYNISEIDFSTWYMASAAPETSSDTQYPPNAVTFERHSGGYYVYVDHLIHHENLSDITADAPASIGQGGYVKGYNYAAPFVYVLKAKTKTLYKYGGTITFTSPDPVPEQPPEYIISGDFDILPSNSINWRDSFQLKPKNFQIPAQCQYLYHEYRVIKDSVIWQSEKITSQTAITSFSYSAYPYSLGVGANLITIRVTADCADSGWTADKYLYINSPSNNSPPVFSAGFFKEYNRTGTTPDYEVVVGSRLNLRIINDYTKNPPWPYDPDGDPITYTWLFQDSSSSWIRSLPQEYGFYNNEEAYYNIIASELGYHSVRVIARDSFGAESTRTVGINVIPENPIPLIDGPTEVKENRPLPQPISGSRSYSPAGYSIVEYIWENKKDKYTTPGTETIKLDVVDSKGLKSLSPAVHTLTVLPDEPPYISIDAPPLAIRNTPVTVTMDYGSPDGDTVVHVQVLGYYDANNNGVKDAAEGFSFNFTGLTAGETTTRAAGGNQLTFKKLSDTTFQVSASRVGKVYFEGQATEDYGKVGYSTEAEYVDVINQAPSVSFVVEGKNEQPTQNTTQNYSPSTILKNWSLFQTNTKTALAKAPYTWYANGDKLESGMGVGNLYQKFYKYGYAYHNRKYNVPIADYGFGPNGITPYRGIQTIDSQRTQPVLIPSNIAHIIKNNQYVYDLKNIGSILQDLNWVEQQSRAGTYFSSVDILKPVSAYSMIRSNPTHIFFDVLDNQYYGGYQAIYALNKSKIPRHTYQVKAIPRPSGWTSDWYGWHQWENNASPYDYMIYMPNEKKFTVNLPFFSSQDQRNYPNWRTEAQQGNFSHASSMKDVQVKAYIWNKEVTGKTIYEIRQTSSDIAYAYYYRDSDDYVFDYTGGFPGHTTYFITTYDAATGAQIASEKIRVQTNGNNYSASLTVKGDNLVLIHRRESGDIEFLELNRNLQQVERKVVTLPTVTNTYAINYKDLWGNVKSYSPALYTCSYGMSVDANKDDKGNHYFFASRNCTDSGGKNVNWDTAFMELNPDFPVGLYIVQIKPDFTLGSVIKILGDQLSNVPAMPEDNFYENSPIMVINNAANKIYARTYIQGYWSNSRSPVTSVVDLSTGTAQQWDRQIVQYSGTTGSGISPFYIDQNGNVLNGGWGTFTASGTLENPNRHEGEEIDYSSSVTGGYTHATSKGYGAYVGDGIYVSTYQRSYSYGLSADSVLILDVGTPWPGSNMLRIGQLQSPDTLADAEITFTMNMYTAGSDSNLAGFSFRMAEPTNRYAVETNGTTLYLSKYVNGARTVLASAAFPFVNNTDYAFKVQMQGSSLKVYLDGVPYFNVADSTFASGKFGPFTDKPLVTFSNISTALISPPDVDWMHSYAIWENGTAQAEVRYSSIVFDDPENDPRAGNYQWTIQHTPKFLNNQGVSALHGQTLASPALKFDKVGNYRITLKAQDDPHPSYLYPSNVFAGYRQWSNEYWRMITVHRRPVAQFTLSINPSTKNVVWNDQSYDPDRWQSPTLYDTENTGINYQATRGILERRYYYITPSGTKVNSMLVTPQETGVYTVGLQVKDEYGAWSYWAEQQITITQPVPPDDPPTPGFNLSKTTLYRGETLAIASTAWDKEDGPAANLQHEYYIRNLTEGTGETLQSTSRGTWNKVFSSVGVMEIRQVVYDSKGQSAQLVKQVTVLNRAPAAEFDWTPKPAFEGDSLNLLNLSQDPDGDAMTYIWTIQGPDGYSQTGTAKNISISGSSTLNRPGTYRVTLRVRDHHGAEAAVTRDISVLALGIQGYVLHTDDWEENRQRFNEKNPGSARPADWFWAGEAFRLAADVTDTGTSATKPVTVEAEASPELRKSLEPASPDSVRWEGLLRSADAGFPLEELPQGPYTFVFTVRYSNGAVKTSAVTIQIRGTVQQIVQVHRLQ